MLNRNILFYSSLIVILAYRVYQGIESGTLSLIANQFLPAAITTTSSVPMSPLKVSSRRNAPKIDVVRSNSSNSQGFEHLYN